MAARSRSMTSVSKAAAGFAMVEVMVTVVVMTFGLLGVAGLVSRSFVTETEAVQRTQASMLLQDMASRIEANRAQVAAYVTGDNGLTGYPTNEYPPTGAVIACNGAATIADRDRCDWGQLMAGSEERIAGDNAGVLIGAIGCVYELDAFNRVYAIAISWMAASPGAAPLIDPNFPPTGCGRDRFGNENQRRVMVTMLRIGNLAAP